MNPVYPAQTRVVVFVACENAYTFTVAELGDDESPLRAPEGTQGNKKKGAKKGSKKGGKKGLEGARAEETVEDGDVLRFGQSADQGVTVFADETPVYRAKPGRHGNRRAVQVVERLEQEGIAL